MDVDDWRHMLLAVGAAHSGFPHRSTQSLLVWYVRHTHYTDPLWQITVQVDSYVSLLRGQQE